MFFLVNLSRRRKMNLEKQSFEELSESNIPDS